ncbi:hypothetical protein EP30_01520 [Bifidobacterium sp. UTCIF-39]|nr:hypothetical protein EP30_01520 [Bifidobacterium sp. UTCIF-39]
MLLSEIRATNIIVSFYGFSLTRLIWAWDVEAHGMLVRRDLLMAATAYAVEELPGSIEHDGG